MSCLRSFIVDAAVFADDVAIMANNAKGEGEPYLILETDAGGFSEAKKYRVIIEEVAE